MPTWFQQCSIFRQKTIAENLKDLSPKWASRSKLGKERLQFEHLDTTKVKAWDKFWIPDFLEHLISSMRYNLFYDFEFELCREWPYRDVFFHKFRNMSCQAQLWTSYHRTYTLFVSNYFSHRLIGRDVGYFLVESFRLHGFLGGEIV